MICAVIDRTTSDAPLSKGAYIQGKTINPPSSPYDPPPSDISKLEGDGFGIAEQWIGRLGYMTARREGKDAFSGNALVVFYPKKPAPGGFIIQLEKYVSEGGVLIVLDDPENTQSTANTLLAPFGLRIKQDQSWQGVLTIAEGWPSIDAPNGYEVTGGSVVARFLNRPVAAMVSYGKGRVLVIGFGSLFNDKNMDKTWLAEPDSIVMKRYNAFYALIRLAVEGHGVNPAEYPDASGSGYSSGTSSAFESLPSNLKGPTKPATKPTRKKTTPPTDKRELKKGLPDLPGQESGL